MFRVLAAFLVLLLGSSEVGAAPVVRSQPLSRDVSVLENARASQGGPPGSAAASLDQRATDLSRSLSELTGLGISPLMTMAFLSVVHWWTHDPASGPPPWHASGWFAGSLAAIALLALLVKLFGSSLPTPIQKFQRAFEHQARKLTGLIAAGTFVPIIATGLDAVSASSHQAPAAADAVAMVPQAAGIGEATNTLMALVVMGLAWTVSQGIESLIFLSPFALLDALLLSLRGALLGLVVTAGVFARDHPLLVSLPILGCLLLLFLLAVGWCVRLNGFVGTYALDMLLRRWRRPEMARPPYLAFLGRGSGLAPARVRCRVAREGDRLVVGWRRAFVGPLRTGQLQADGCTLVRGMLWPEVETVAAEGARFWLFMPPRYRAHQDAVMASLGIGGRDGAVLKGWTGVKAFLRALGPRRPAIATAAERAGKDP